jgi:hypothetical protein
MLKMKHAELAQLFLKFISSFNFYGNGKAENFAFIFTAVAIYLFKR